MWAYAAIASGVLFLILIAAGIALFRARKKWRAAGKVVLLWQFMKKMVKCQSDIQFFLGDIRNVIELLRVCNSM